MVVKWCYLGKHSFDCFQFQVEEELVTKKGDDAHEEDDVDVEAAVSECVICCVFVASRWIIMLFWFFYSI